MKQLAGQNGLPIFVYLWVWATARVTHPEDSRMLCLPCTLTVGRGLVSRVTWYPPVQGHGIQLISLQWIDGSGVHLLYQILLFYNCDNRR